MKNNTLNTVYNYINNYDLLSVTEKAANGNIIKTFSISGIRTFKNNLKDIAFRCFCSVPVVVNSFVKSAEILENGCVYIDCETVNYTITPAKEKTQRTACENDKFYIDTFIDKNMIDTTQIKTKNNVVYLPVDYVKIGEITPIQETKIKTLIDNFLEGAAEKYQCCRVPAFSVEFGKNNYKINGHIYNIENGEYLNTVLVYDSKTDFNKINPYADFIEFAKSFLN